MFKISQQKLNVSMIIKYNCDNTKKLRSSMWPVGDYRTQWMHFDFKCGKSS
jgi:hypothetical protein